MKKTKLVSILLILAMALSVLAGCGSSEGEKEAAQEPETRIVVDHTGAEVELPTEINRVVISSILPLPSVYCLFRGSADDLIGMHPSSKAAAENSFLIEQFPEIADIDTGFVQNGEVNIEELMAMDPDVVFYLAANKEEGELYKNAGIPAVAFSTTIADFHGVETYAEWISLLGDIYGEQELANELIEYGRDIHEMIASKTSALEDGQKPRVLMLYKYSNGVINPSGSDFFGQYWIETAGGVNVAAENSGTPEVNMEQIYEWNPDMIFITNFSEYLPEDFYNNSIEGHDWSVVKAVQDKKVYKFPLGMYRWFPPSSDTPLSLMWLAKTMQPEMFADIDLDQEIKDYFLEYYDRTVTDSDLEKIYHPAREAAGL